MADASRKRGTAAAGGDRLSALPDALLHSVMSFLTARQAVQTTAPSRRWRGLWRSVPCLDIDYREFDTAPAATAGSAVASGRWHDDEVWRKLDGFTFNLLMDHNAPVLDRFRLHVGERCRDLDVERWVCRGIRCRPAVLEVAMASSVPAFELSPLGQNSTRTRTTTC